MNARTEGHQEEAGLVRRRALVTLAVVLTMSLVAVAIGLIGDLGVPYLVAVIGTAIVATVVILLVRDALLGRYPMSRVRVIISLLIPALAVAAFLIGRWLHE
jgi:hypothetical protein